MKQTLSNLTKAFIGESQARNRYDFYAKVAKKEGYEQIAEIFQITAENEKEHAKRIFEHIQELKGKAEEITVETFAPVVYKKTADNLQAAIDGEKFEHSEMYPEYAKIAKEEGLPHIAKRLLAIAEAEKHHEARYTQILKEVKNKTVFKKEKEVEWMCRECGYIHVGKTPPKECPSCDHPSSYYQIRCEKY